MYLAGRMSSKDCVGYIVFQLLGATVGAGLLFWFMNSGIGYNFGGITSPDEYLATNVLQPGATSGMALLAKVSSRSSSYSSFFRTVEQPIAGLAGDRGFNR